MIPAIDNAAVPVFETVNIFWEKLPTAVESIAKDVGETLIAGVGGVGVTNPLPDNATNVGEPAAL